MGGSTELEVFFSSGCGGRVCSHALRKVLHVVCTCSVQPGTTSKKRDGIVQEKRGLDGETQFALLLQLASLLLVMGSVVSPLQTFLMSCADTRAGRTPTLGGGGMQAVEERRGTSTEEMRFF